MKKTNLTFIVFILSGLLIGTIVSQLLLPVHSLQLLTKSTEINWHPKADLQFLKYDLNFLVKLNLTSVIFAAISIWVYRKL